MDMVLVTKRKRMMDSVGHYARPELLSLNHDARPARTVVTTPASDIPHPRSTDHERLSAADLPGRFLAGAVPGLPGDADGAPDQRPAILRSQAG
jgi:aliphatic nitrilase